MYGTDSDLVLSQSITPWVVYCASKNTSQLASQSQDATKNPITRLLCQLSGISPHPPKELQPEQQWSKEFYDTKIKSKFKRHWASAGLADKYCTAEHVKFTAACFAHENADVRKEWVACVQQEHEKALKGRQDVLNSPPPTDAPSRQEYVELLICHTTLLTLFIYSAIDCLGSFVGPIICSIGEVLGMHVCMLIGRPEPRKNGSISILSYVISIFAFTH